MILIGQRAGFVIPFGIGDGRLGLVGSRGLLLRKTGAVRIDQSIFEEPAIVPPIFLREGRGGEGEPDGDEQKTDEFHSWFLPLIPVSCVPSTAAADVEI